VLRRDRIHVVVCRYLQQIWGSRVGLKKMEDANDSAKQNSRLCKTLNDYALLGSVAYLYLQRLEWFAADFYLSTAIIRVTIPCFGSNISATAQTAWVRRIQLILNDRQILART
jgi:hypothetical protein